MNLGGVSSASLTLGYQSSIMPRSSQHVLFLCHLENVVLQQRFLSSVALLTADSDADSDVSEDEEMHVLAVTAVSLTYSVLDSSRFCFCSRVYCMRDVHSRVPERQKIVSGEKFSDEEFLTTFRIDRSSFHELVDLVR